ncbi:MAG: Trk system potassium transporter TrkA [Bacteroidota bacterium]
MKIIIAGAGEVGFHLSKLLSFESHDITLIDIDEDRLAYADKHLDIRTIHGDAISLKLLKEADVKHTDLLISVTSLQAINITVCAIGKQLGAKRTIARVSNQEFIDKKAAVNFSNMGIDELISPESLAAEEVMLLLNQSGFADTFEFENGALTMIGLTLSSNAPFVGKTVQESADYFPGLHFTTIALQRYGTQYTIIPNGSTVFKKADRVYFITDSEGVDELYKLSGAKRKQIKNVMILGGSNIGKKLATELCAQKYRVKLVEKDYDKALMIADLIPKTLVIRGDGTNVDLLEEENINQMDAFIAVTDDSETNIMSCLVANSKKVRKTVALVENMDYFQLSHSIGINSLINKKLIAANNIFRHIRKGNVAAMTKINNLNAELLEFIVKKDSLVCNKRIKEITFPKEAVVGGVIRNNEGLIALGDFLIEENDHIVICCLPKAIKKVEKLFS